MSTLIVSPSKIPKPPPRYRYRCQTLDIRSYFRLELGPFDQPTGGWWLTNGTGQSAYFVVVNDADIALV